MFGGMNPRQMQRMMAQMGIKNEDLPVKRVVIEKQDGSTLVVEPASVIMIEMQGQQSFQVSGTISSGAASQPIAPAQAAEPTTASETDIAIVAQQAGVPSERAKKALENANGDIAQAIMDLQQ